jgi:hypothetical protein
MAKGKKDRREMWLEIKRQKEAELRARRLENLALARERMKEIAAEKREKKERELNKKVGQVQDKIDMAVKKSLDKYSVSAVKAAFISAFQASGGKKSLISWIKENSKNRQEYYRMLVTLLRQSEDDAAGSGSKIVVNITGLDPSANQHIVIEGPNRPIDITASEVLNEL